MPIVEPEEAEEARRAVQVFEAGIAGCLPEHVDRMLTKLATAYPPARGLSEEEAEAKRLIYAELLHDLPYDILSAAFRRAAQTCKFFPTVAEIRQAAEPALTMRRWRLFCLQRLIGKHERDYLPPIPPEELCKPEDAKRILADLARERAAKGLDVSPPSQAKEERRERVKSRRAPEKSRGTSPAEKRK